MPAWSAGYHDTVPLGSGFESKVLGANLNIVSQEAFHDLPDTFPFNPVDETCYARYMGCAPGDFSSVVLGFTMGATAAVLGGGYAELGIGIGDFPSSDAAVPIDPTITPIGFVSIATEIAAIANAQLVKAVTAAVKAGRGVWALFVVNAVTTDPQLRAILNANAFGRTASRANTRISTNLNTALTFSGAASGGSVVAFVQHAAYVR